MNTKKTEMLLRLLVQYCGENFEVQDEVDEIAQEEMEKEEASS